MKILGALLGLVFALLIAVYVAAFTDFGNGLVKPYAQNLIKEKSGFDVKFDKFQIRPTSVDIVANVNGEIVANVNGGLSIFSQSLDLKYDVAVSDLKSLGVKLSEAMKISGIAKGKFSDFRASGVGQMLGSSVSFDANLKDYKPLSLKLDAKNLQVEKALALAGQPIYARGKISAVANIVESGGKPNGTANIDILDVKTDNALIAKDFNVTLPSNFAANGKVVADVKDGIVNAKSAVITPLATIGSDKTIYDPNSNTLSSDIKLIVDDLAKFESVVGQKLSGAFKANGNVIATAGELKNFDVKIEGFGGNVDAVLNGGKLIAKISSLKLDELVKIAAFPAFVGGTISGEAVLNDVHNTQNISGSVKLATKNARLNPAELKQVAKEINLSKPLAFELNANADVASSKAKFNASLNSELLKLKSLSGVYGLDDENADVKFDAGIDDLGKFEELIGKKLSGKVDVKGTAKLAKGALSELDLNANALGGKIDANLKNEKLTANLSALSLKDAFTLAALPNYADAVIDGSVNLSGLDPKNLSGTAKFNVKNGIVNSAVVAKELDKRFPNGTKFDANADVAINGGKAKFDAVANLVSNANKNLIALKNLKGDYELESGSAKADFELSIRELKEIEFLVGRPLYGPLLVIGDATKTGEKLSANVNSRLFNGDLKAVLKDDILNANLKSFTAKGLTDFLGLSHVYDGTGDMTMDYNLASQKGKFDVAINDGKLAKTDFTEQVRTFTGRDITSEIYKNSKIKGTINKNLIDFNADMNATRSHVSVIGGKYDMATKAVNVPIKMNYEKTDIDITVTGTSDNPKYTIGSDYLKGKAVKELDRFLDKKFGKDDENGTTGDAKKDAKKDAIKGLLKGLF